MLVYSCIYCSNSCGQLHILYCLLIFTVFLCFIMHFILYNKSAYLQLFIVYWYELDHLAIIQRNCYCKFINYLHHILKYESVWYIFQYYLQSDTENADVRHSVCIHLSSTSVCLYLALPSHSIMAFISVYILERITVAVKLNTWSHVYSLR